MIKSIGEYGLGERDSGDIPCNIVISKICEKDFEDLNDHDEYGEGELDENGAPYTPLRKWVRYELVGDFMQKQGLYAYAFHYVADTKKELQQLVREKILPSYRNAARDLLDLCEGKTDNSNWARPVPPLPPAPPLSEVAKEMFKQLTSGTCVDVALFSGFFQGTPTGYIVAVRPVLGTGTSDIIPIAIIIDEVFFDTYIEDILDGEGMVSRSYDS